MGIEEQKEEREVLDSIFPDEITGALGWLPFDPVLWAMTKFLFEYSNASGMPYSSNAPFLSLLHQL
jgi:hypothetical protein